MRRSRLLIALTLVAFLFSVFLTATNAQTISWEKYLYTIQTDSGYGVAADSDYIIVVGKYLNTTSYAKAFVAKFSKADGSISWIKGLKIHDNDYAYDVAVDDQGNIYVVGETQDTATNEYYGFVAKFGSNGNLKWSRIWGGAFSYIGRGVALDSSGYVYVTGEISSGTSYDCLIMKLNTSDGTVIWSKKIGTTDGLEKGFDIAIDSNDNVYVTGENASAYSAFLLKIDTDGNMIWGKTWKIYQRTWSEAVAISPSGDIYIASTVQFPYNISIAKFDPNGNLLWAKMWDSGKYDFAHSLAVDSQHAYLVGHVADPSTQDWAALIIAFDHSGNLAWDVIWNGTNNERAWGVASGSLYVVGDTASPSPALTDISGTLTDITDQPKQIFGAPEDVSVSLVSLGVEYTPVPEEGRSGAAGDPDIFILRLEAAPPVGGEIITPSPKLYTSSLQLIISTLAILLIALGLIIGLAANKKKQKS